MLFDTHAHYDDEAFDADRETLLASLPAQGVGLIVNPGCTVDSSRTAVALAERFPHVYAAVGIHPEECADYAPEQIHALRALAAAPKVVAIGEIGLDYYWPENPPRELQQQVLRDQLALARELDLPVILHDREAHADCLALVREFPEVRGVFHCFSGSVEMARQLLDLGWMLSFNGALTFKNARKAPEVAAAAPLERLMIETDAPYLTPVPFRGRRNDSGHVHLVAEKIAEIKGLSPDEVARVTLENGKRFFGIA
jgi:TatD DNase family protein